MYLPAFKKRIDLFLIYFKWIMNTGASQWQSKILNWYSKIKLVPKKSISVLFKFQALKLLPFESITKTVSDQFWWIWLWEMYRWSIQWLWNICPCILYFIPSPSLISVSSWTPERDLAHFLRCYSSVPHHHFKPSYF